MQRLASHCRRVVLGLPALVAAAAAAAQCDLEWRSAGSYPGANGIVHAAATWDPDGPGPAAALVVLGGEFTILGDAVASRVVSYDDNDGHCTPLGGGIDGPVRTLLALASGELIAGGSFANAGAAAAANIARFDGVAWHSIGGGTDGTVRAVVRLPNGDLIAGGSFATAGGSHAANIARWDGSAWSALGGGTDAIVCALAVAPNGDVIAGGNFTTAGGQPASRIARWSNGAWRSLGSGCNDEVRGVAVLQSGEVFATGAFTLAGGTGVPRVARWNGAAWSAAGSILSTQVGESLTLLPSGELVLCVQSQGGSTNPSGAGRWTGSGWQSLLTVMMSSPFPPSAVHAVAAAANGTILCGGDFNSVWPNYGDRNVRNLIRVVGGGAVAIGRIDAPVVALAENGTTVLAAGASTPASGFSQRIDAWGPGFWTPFATMNGPIRGLGSRTDGRVVVAGSFYETVNIWHPWWPTTVTYYHFAALVGAGGLTLYDGSLYSSGPWSGPFGSAAIAGPGDANIVAYGPYGACGGDVTGLQPMTAPASGTWLGAITSIAPLPGCVEALATADPSTVLTGGTLYAGGTFAALGHCAQLVGSTWTPLGTGVDATVRTLAARPNGDLIAGGDFTMAGGAPVNHVARWNGIAWSPLGNGVDGPVYATVVLPAGDVIVGGAFTTAGGTPAANLARWNGTTWSAIDGGTNGTVRALLLAADGSLWVGGDFTAAGMLGCGHVARLVSPCPATVASLGSGCTGSGGVNVLMATSLPWQGSTFTSRATGMPALSLVLQVNGLSPINVPLAAILPQGGGNCALLTTPDVLDVYLPAAGVASFRLALPAASVLIGQTIYQQAAPLELDASFAIVALTSSNLLQLTIGGL